jgi:hypothetical protein
MTTNLPNPDVALSDTASQPDEQPVHIPKTSAASQPFQDTTTTELSDDPEEYQMETPESAVLQKAAKVDIDARATISNLLKDKEQEWAAVAAKKGPLQLLDLPLDVLKEIVKEVNFLYLYKLRGRVLIISMYRLLIQTT